MEIKVNKSYFVADIEPSDAGAYVEHLREKQIYDQTLNIPYPYLLNDAEEWIHRVEFETRQCGHSLNWAIRRADGYLIGGIGYQGLDSKTPHRAEIGYWLAKPYWNQGIMTAAVQAVTRYAFARLGLTRITAHVFHFNVGSARVLEKAGYQLEGRLRRHYYKDERIFDGLLYAAVKE